MIYCERCDKLGFDKCLCPKPMYNYQLKLVGHTEPIAGYVDHLIKLGKEYDTPFTVEMLTPSMVVCFWQPGMDKVAWNEPYKRWFEDQQKAYNGISVNVPDNNYEVKDEYTATD